MHYSYAVAACALQSCSVTPASSTITGTHTSRGTQQCTYIYLANVKGLAIQFHMHTLGLYKPYTLALYMHILHLAKDMYTQQCEEQVIRVAYRPGLMHGMNSDATHTHTYTNTNEYVRTCMLHASLSGKGKHG